MANGICRRLHGLRSDHKVVVVVVVVIVVVVIVVVVVVTVVVSWLAVGWREGSSLS